MRRLLTIVGFLLPGIVHAQVPGETHDDSLAWALRVLDSTVLIAEYGPDTPISAILSDGYNLVSVGEGKSPEPYDDTIYLYARGQLPHSAWIRMKTPNGVDKGLEKALGDCEKDLFKMGDFDWREVAPGTVANFILNRLCHPR